VTDLRDGKIYNWLTYPAIATGLIGHALFGGVWGTGSDVGLLDAVAGLALGLLPLAVVSLWGGLGGGDARLMGAIGALGGWRFAYSTLVFGLLAAGVMALAIMARRRMLGQTFRRLGGAMKMALTGRRPADVATAESPTLPFGLALCIGAGAALVEVLIVGHEGVKLILRM
jgi:prepilin peptidase CpaA